MIRALLLFCLPIIAVQTAHAVEITEHRRTLIVHADSATSELNALSAALIEHKFLVETIEGLNENAWQAIDRYVEGIPTQGINIIVYHGGLILAKDKQDQVHYLFDVRGFRNTPSPRNPSIRQRGTMPPALSVNRVASRLARNTARKNLFVVVATDVDDQTQSGRETDQHLNDVFRGLSGNMRVSSSDRAFAIVNKADQEHSNLLSAVTDLIKTNDGDFDRFNKVARFANSKKGKFQLGQHAAEVCSPPNQIREGRFAGDQWVDRFGMCFVWCPAATFTMGDESFEDAQPVEVTVSKGYWISKFELSRSQAELIGIGSGFFSGRESWQPAHGSNIDKIADALNSWRIHRNSVGYGLPTGWSYDVPTEAEWEFACRAGSSEAYPSEPKDMGRYANFADRTLFDTQDDVHYIFAHRVANDGYADRFADVGQFLPNAWGIHDMLGNAAELCCSFYSDKIPSGIDPVDQYLDGPRARRRSVSRGGAWCSPLEYLHVAHRNAFTGTPVPHTGVRLVIRQGEQRCRSSRQIQEAMKKSLKGTK